VIPFVAALAPLVLIVVGLRKWPVRTSTLLLPFLPVLLIVGTSLAFILDRRDSSLAVIAAWLGVYCILRYALRTGDPAPINDGTAFGSVVETWRDLGLTEIEALRLHTRAGSIVIAMRRPGDATVAMITVTETGTKPFAWSLGTVLGDGQGVLVTTPDPIGLLDPTEIRQIVPDGEGLWEVHQQGLVTCHTAGLATDRVVGEHLRDHILWRRERARLSGRWFPTSFVAMMFRPLFHLGPLKERRRAQRQLHRLIRDVEGSVEGESEGV
jgi:hypothetical protein